MCRYPKTISTTLIGFGCAAALVMASHDNSAVLDLPAVVKTKLALSLRMGKLVKAVEKGELTQAVDLFWDPPIGLSTWDKEIEAQKGLVGIIEMESTDFASITRAPTKGYRLFIEKDSLKTGRVYCVMCRDQASSFKIAILRYEPGDGRLRIRWEKLSAPKDNKAKGNSGTTP